MITGAVGNIGYSMAFMIGQGRMFGPDQGVILHLFDIPLKEKELKGLAMELDDCAFPLLRKIVYTVDPLLAFKDIDFGVFCGARPRGPGMERKELLSENAKIFKEKGEFLDKYAKKDC